ncbi:AAA ATPase-like protein [Sphingomonas faeni]|uniref:AAA ATPase-like protein n=1 Tax=Sphingomonas faeni TaxID=185950 RepID=A0A2T5TY59_9SPHN|nr:ATP-binding protein [Sphingomonas faeni]PTW44197.1 AAA ATPase-like protein [Sphingomonas faeni]
MNVSLASTKADGNMLLRVWNGLWQWLVASPVDQRHYGAVIQPLEPEHADIAARAEATPIPFGGRLINRNETVRIMNAFDSAHPVRQRKNLHGRDDKLEALFDAVLFNRQHAVIHGARGSGKTSLAQVFGDYADQQGAVVIYAACEAATSFAELIRPYLAFIPESSVSLKEKVNFDRDMKLLDGEFGARAIVDLFSYLSDGRQVILIFDEFDRAESAAVVEQVATLIKLLSDARSSVQVMIVGIGRTLDDLIRCHPSLRRHLVPVPIGRISQGDMLALIDTGAARAGVTFDAACRTLITSISCGSPYHLQLFCYVAAIEATRRGTRNIDMTIMQAGMARAFDTWAMVNGPDATLFRSLETAAPETREGLEHCAREAAVTDCVHADSDMQTVLGSALLADESHPDRFYFRDGAAPQFLLAILAIGHAAQAANLREG